MPLGDRPRRVGRGGEVEAAAAAGWVKEAEDARKVAVSPSIADFHQLQKLLKRLNAADEVGTSRLYNCNCWELVVFEVKERKIQHDG